MYKVFNMGHRMEIYADEKNLEQILLLGEKDHYETRIIGRVEEHKGKRLTIQSEFGEFIY